MPALLRLSSSAANQSNGVHCAQYFFGGLLMIGLTYRLLFSSTTLVTGVLGFEAAMWADRRAAAASCRMLTCLYACLLVP